MPMGLVLFEFTPPKVKLYLNYLNNEASIMLFQLPLAGYNTTHKPVDTPKQIKFVISPQVKNDCWSLKLLNKLQLVKA